mmetsp:Transcript_24665/g.53861  ORF Transcript_24665/g.53861 Transcript_24665/m.53861 type:complete len:108 (+) Transcript_24665:3-326(+)
MLTWRGGRAHVVLTQQAGSQDVLRAAWQAAWLHEQGQGGMQHVGALNPDRSRSHEGHEGHDAELALLGSSVAAMRVGFPAFEKEATALGWKMDVLTLHLGEYRVSVA